MSQVRYNFAAGFSNLSQEHQQIKLPHPEYNIPSWLNGSNKTSELNLPIPAAEQRGITANFLCETVRCGGYCLNAASRGELDPKRLIKVGPAQFTIGKTKVNHWFDGLAMLYKFDCNNGNIIFSNAFIKSEQYQSHLNGRMQCDEFGTKAPLNLLERLKNIFATMSGKTTLNPSCNVNISQMNKTFIAMTEVNNQIEFNPATLATLKQISYTDSLDGQMTTAHPVLDNKTQELFNILIDIKPNKIKYQIYKTNVQIPQVTRELVAEFTKPYLFYMHSFFVTRNYVIVYNGPMQTTATHLLTNTFNEALKYCVLLNT